MAIRAGPPLAFHRSQSAGADAHAPEIFQEIGTIRGRAAHYTLNRRHSKGSGALMAIRDRGIAFRQLDALFSVGVIGGLTDAQLLERFTSYRDETAELAFRALVERHGPMVLRVCRDVLRDVADADDAFQATFLVLVRRAGSLWVRDSVGPWLYQVAHRTASCARTAAARRRRYERRATEMTARTAHDVDRDDLGTVVHEEVGRLPARYREAIVLCLVEGLTPEQAARHMNCPVGTVHSRLARGRERLRGRLTRRGVAVPAGLLFLGTAGNASSAAVSPALADATIRGALQLMVGKFSPGAVSVSVAALTGMMMRSMLMARIRMTTATLLMVGALAVGAGVLARQEPGNRKPGEAQQVTGAGPAAKRSASDSLGDPLPTGARLRLGTLRFRPPSIVVDLALSHDETTVVTVGDELIVWDAATGRERWRVHGPEYGFKPPAAAYGTRAIAFSADGSRFYTPGRPEQNEVAVWETGSGRHEVLKIDLPNRNGEMKDVHLDSPARSVDVTPDGRKLAVGSADGLVVCDLHGKVFYEIANSHGPFQFNNSDRLTFGGHYSLGRFSPDGAILAVVTSDRPEEIRLYEAETGRELRKVALAARLVRLAFSPDGKQLATTERDSAVRLYDVATGKRTWSHIVQLTNIFENYTSTIAFSPDGKVLAAGATDNRIYLINPSTGEEVAHLAGHHWYPWTLAFTANSQVLYSSGWDPVIRRWNVASRKQLALPIGDQATGVVAASPDGKTLAYGDDSGAIRLVQATNGKEQRTLALPGTEYSQLVFSPDGRRLAGGGCSGDQVHIAVWEIPGGKLLHRWDWPKGRDSHSGVESLCFTPDGTRLAAAVFRQSAAFVWDLKVGQQIAQLHHSQVYGLSFSPDGRTLATAGWDSIIRFWETGTGNLRREFKVAEHAKGDLSVYSVCYAPAGGLIATVHLDGIVRIWQADEMLLRKQFQVGSWGHGPVSFSPDGLWLAAGVMDGSVEVWDPLSAQRLWNVGRHQNRVYTVAFGRDARTLVSGGQDGLCFVWDLRPSGNPTNYDPDHLWHDLEGEDGPAVFQAMCTLSEMPDRTITLLAEKLRPVTNVIDLDHVDEGKSPDEVQRLRRMKRLLVNKEPEVESAVTVRRAISLLAQIGTPDAIGLLKHLAKQDPKRDVARLATSELDRLRIPGTP
jgi:RNA polymerase sigma factor (sigma-70 family)